MNRMRKELEKKKRFAAFIKITGYSQNRTKNDLKGKFGGEKAC